MTSRRFVLLGAGLALALAASLAAFNVCMDEFGLYGLRTGPIRIWGYERASKFLLASRYVPEHFEGLLVGSSTADKMMDTRRIGGYRVYNLSVNGGNICEAGRIARQALARGSFRFLVLSLAPYLTKDCAMKTNELEPGLERSALGSLFTLRFYQAKLRALLHPEADPHRDSWSGFMYEVRTSGEAGMGARERPLSAESPVDPDAARALDLLLHEARSRGVAVLAYFHPLLRPEANGRYPEAYERQIRAQFHPGDLLWDFNDGTYGDITEDPANFLDGAHLSEKGAGLVLAEIERRLGERVGRVAERAQGVRP